MRNGRGTQSYAHTRVRPHFNRVKAEARAAQLSSAQMPRCRPNRLNTLSAHKFTSLIEILIWILCQSFGIQPCLATGQDSQRQQQGGDMRRHGEPAKTSRLAAAITNRQTNKQKSLLLLLLSPDPLPAGTACKACHLTSPLLPPSPCCLPAISLAQRFSIYAQRKSFVILCMP